jgi:hypothetical protein
MSLWYRTKSWAIESEVILLQHMKSTTLSRMRCTQAFLEKNAFLLYCFGMFSEHSDEMDFFSFLLSTETMLKGTSQLKISRM